MRTNCCGNFACVAGCAGRQESCPDSWFRLAGQSAAKRETGSEEAVGATIEMYGKAWDLSFLSFLPIQVYVLQFRFRSFPGFVSCPLRVAHGAGFARDPLPRQTLGRR